MSPALRASRSSVLSSYSASSLSSSDSAIVWRRPLSNRSLFIWYSLMLGIIYAAERTAPAQEHDNALLLRRNHRQQHVRRLARAAMQGDPLAEDLRRTVARVVVQIGRAHV